MKRHMLHVCLLFCLVVGACHRPITPAVSGHVYSGKVFRSMCGNIGVQFIGSTHLGQAVWVDPSDSTKEYHNVFRVANSCTWRASGKSGDDIRFRFVPAVPQECAQCMAYIATPDTAYHIQVVE